MKHLRRHWGRGPVESLLVPNPDRLSKHTPMEWLMIAEVRVSRNIWNRKTPSNVILLDPWLEQPGTAELCLVLFFFPIAAHIYTISQAARTLEKVKSFLFDWKNELKMQKTHFHCFSLCPRVCFYCVCTVFRMWLLQLYSTPKDWMRINPKIVLTAGHSYLDNRWWKR